MRIPPASFLRKHADKSDKELVDSRAKKRVGIRDVQTEKNDKTEEGRGGNFRNKKMTSDSGMLF